MAGFEVGSVIARVKADITDFQKGIGKAKEETSNFQDRLAGLGNTIKNVLVVGAAAGAAGLVFIGKSALDAAANFEQTKIAFETMLGSAAKAGKLLADLQDFAKRTPFNLVELQETTKRLLAYGVEGDKVIETLTTLGNISSAVGRDKMPQLTLAFGQVKAIGRLTGMELRQFSETGVPLLGLLTEQFKVSTAEMQDMISAGEIGFPAVQKALESLGGESGKWGDMMDQQSKTLSGSISNLQDSWTQLMVVLGTFFIPVATKLIQTLTAILTPLQNVIQTSGTWQEALQKMGINVQGFEAVLQEFRTFLFEYLLPAMKVVIDTFLANWQYLSVQFKGIWSIITGIVQLAWSIVYGIIKVGLALLTGDWDKAWKAILQMVDGAWTGIKNIFNGILEFISGWGGQLIDRLSVPFREALRRAQDAVNKIKNLLDFTKRNSPSVVDIVNRGVDLVNKALDGLEWSTTVTPHAAVAVATNGVAGGSMFNQVTVNLDGAMISDEAGATRLAEIVGDNIIRKLQYNVRF